MEGFGFQETPDVPTALKIEVPQSELDSAYAERKKNLSDANFEEELKKRNLTADDMRDTLRRELVVKKLLDQEVTGKVAVTAPCGTVRPGATCATAVLEEESATATPPAGAGTRLRGTRDAAPRRKPTRGTPRNVEEPEASRLVARRRVTEAAAEA